jgi:demethylmenaquinone methyltransferase / 2-methoxy-6-polyprenyl-1,4-benzoquinol methylase
MCAEKNQTRPLHDMFTKVPPSYDLLNRLLTLHMDERWRKKAAVACLENHPRNVLDLCTGTGDLAIRLRKTAPPETAIAALDFSRPMLESAMKKAARANAADIEFIHADAAAMPFEDHRFDSIGIAFAFRNLTFRNPFCDAFLTEILRVLKPGGRFVIVETSQPESAFIRFFFRFYLRYISAPLGGLISGHYGAYSYLAHSAIHYYDQTKLSELLLEAGFSAVSCHPNLLRVSTVYIARK